MRTRGEVANAMKDRLNTKKVKEDLERVREQLRRTTEVYEVQSAALKSSHDQLHVVNAELRSAAEGMAVSRDTLSALVEQLHSELKDRRQAETALIESKEQYRTLFNSIDEGFCVVEMIFNDAGEPCDWRFLEVNPAFEKNNCIHDALGRTMLEMVPNIEPKWFDIYGSVAESLEPKRFEMRSAALDRWFNLYAFPVGEPAEHKLAVLFTDVTMQKQREEDLRASNERMRLLIESATHVSIFTTDKNGVVNSWNSGSARIYGYAEEEILGREVAVLFSEEDRERGVHFREMETAVKEGRAFDERWHRRKDGTTFYASGLTQPIGDGSEGFVKIARDMTEQLRAEEARHEKEVMQSLVDAQESERRRIARDLHDELGQQLTALRLKLNRVSEEAPEPLEGQISEIKEIAKCLDEGVDFLAWELRPAALDDLGLVPAVEKYVREWSSYTGVPGRVNSTALAGKRFDPSVETALYRIVQECLNNVHKHAQARNAQVTLRIRRGKIMLTVDDDGAGFDVCDHDVQTRGIGLIGMQERVQMIGGTMEIESENGHGTTVFVKAPIARV